MKKYNATRAEKNINVINHYCQGHKSQSAYTAQNSAKIGSTKFTVLKIRENSQGTLRPRRMQQYTHGIISESATRSMVQNSAYTAQNSTKVAQNSGVVLPLKAVGGRLT